MKKRLFDVLKEGLEEKKCKHNSTWIVGGGSGEWCYVCGAYRGLRPVEGTTNALAPRTQWVRPTGDKENNPYEKLNYKVRR